MSFAAGETIVLHEVWRERNRSARPMTAVRDEGDLVALWFPLGTPYKRPVPVAGAPSHASRGERLADSLDRREWVFEDVEWDVSTLVLVRPGDWHAVWCSWRDGEHLPWYVNQEPIRRTSIGFDTMDLALDVVIFADGTWRWKDEDELDTFVDRGVLDDALATSLRLEGPDVVLRARRNEPPFKEPWPFWQPDPAWPTPALPAGWEARCR